MSLQTGAKFVLSSVGLVTFCLCSDHVVYGWEEKWKALPQGLVVRAAVDNLVHGLVGGWTWANCVIVLGGQLTSTFRLLQVACSVAMASALDLDHFVAARSVAMKDALSLKERPFAHNTTLILVIAALLYLCFRLFPSLANHPLTGDLPAMFLTAMLSHHLRDADRRGLWFGPFFTTPPIPHKLYVLLVTLLPTITPLPALLPTLLRALVEMPRGLGVTRQRPSVVLDV